VGADWEAGVILDEGILRALVDIKGRMRLWKVFPSRAGNSLL
jgi:hypothetical protein